MAVNKSSATTPGFAPIEEPLQRGEVVYNALLEGILRGDLAPGAQLNADNLAQQLRVSTTPVRDALNRLAKDGIVVKLPYQGWFVRRFEQKEIREVYEVRAGLECFIVRLACQRITPEEIEQLRQHQSTGEQALERGDLEAYRLYNQELHAAILRAARNAELAAVASQVSLKTQMLSSRTIRLEGRPRLAIEEHRQILEAIARRDVPAAQELMEHHILGAMEDMLRHGLD
jgi:DNA-binding GntR family transcriptional regulator